MWKDQIPVNCDEGFGDHTKYGTNDVGPVFDVRSSDHIIEQRVWKWGDSQQHDRSYLLDPPPLLGNSQYCRLLWILC